MKEINNEEDFIRAMMETPYTLGDDIEDRNSRLGSSQQYDIYENGGVETYNTVALKKVIPENEYMTRGKKLEPVMAQWAAEEHGWGYEPAATIRWELEGVPFRDTPDFLITLRNGKQCLEEVKTHITWMRESYGDEYSSDVRDYVYVQCQFHLNTPYAYQNGLDECRVVASFGGEKPEVFIIDRNPTAGFNLHRACRNFWRNHVLLEIHPPPVEPQKYALLRDENMLTASENHEAKHQRREEIVGQMKVLKAEKDKIDKWFKTEIGENVGIQNDAVRYTWKANKPKEVINYKALVAELAPDPELIAKYTKTVLGSRILRSLKPKGVK